MSEKPTEQKDTDQEQTETPQLSKEEILAQVNARLEEVDGLKKDGQRVVKPLGKEALNATTTEDVESKPEPVKVATASAKVDTDGNLEPGEHRKLQAMLGAAKSKDSKAYAGLKDENRVIEDGDIDPRSTLIFANCENCEFVVDSLCTKVFVQGCKNVTFTFKAKIVTHTFEAYKCEGLRSNFEIKIGTMQLDMSKDLHFHFLRHGDFGSAIWAGCYKLRMTFADDDTDLTTGFGDMQEDYADLNEERSQFKLHFLNGNLVNEKVVRLDNGFPTTKREKDSFEERQERNMKKLADSLGIVVPKKKREEPKVGRNEPCICGSGRKYKKCCGAGK